MSDPPWVCPVLCSLGTQEVVQTCPGRPADTQIEERGGCCGVITRYMEGASDCIIHLELCLSWSSPWSVDCPAWPSPCLGCGLSVVTI